MAGASEPVPSGEDEEGHEEEAVSEQRLTLDSGGRGPSVQNCS